MKQYRWKAYMIYYIVEIVLVVITLFLMMYGLIHPRPHIWTIILMLFLFVISMHREIKKVRAGRIKATKIIRYFFGIPIGLYMAYAIGLFGTVSFPKHMAWEYKGDMQRLKKESQERYYFSRMRYLKAPQKWNG